MFFFKDGKQLLSLGRRWFFTAELTHGGAKQFQKYGARLSLLTTAGLTGFVVPSQWLTVELFGADDFFLHRMNAVCLRPCPAQNRGPESLAAPWPACLVLAEKVPLFVLQTLGDVCLQGDWFYCCPLSQGGWGRESWL